MTDMGLQLSAYIDGELSPAEARALEALLASDPGLQAELEALRSANDFALEDFGAMLSAPVPLTLARAINSAETPAAAGPRRAPVWAALAAGLALFVVGTGGGYVAGQRNAPVTHSDWVAEVAAYHPIYARQGRHLVEVPASDSEHIVAWLGDQVGVPFEIPDLQAEGLTFEGARLLAASGKPVGQLMYRDADGTVVALCFTASPQPPTEGTIARNVNGFDALIWGEEGVRFVLIGPEGYQALPAIAESARSA
jgi:anti-sigma factor RsiW